MVEPDRESRAHTVGEAEVVRGVFDAVPIVLAGLQGPEHRFSAVNAAYRALVGSGDVLGRRVVEVWPEGAGRGPSELVERVYRSGEPETMRGWRIKAAVDESGELGEFYVDLVFAPRRDEHGTIIGVVLYGTDVTEQVRKRQAAQRDAAEARRRYTQAREVVSELQEALLPTGLPLVPRARLAARYLVAAHDQAAGGDWFDAVALPDGRLVLVVGDVVGHGVAASAAMGQFRAVLDHLLHSESELTAVLTGADRYASRVPSLRAATLAFVVLDPDTGELSYCRYGHPPPLVVGDDGATRYLPGKGTGPLGTGAGPELARATLAPGETVLLYSDGLVERPGRTLDEGMADLARVAAGSAARRAFSPGATHTAAERVCGLTVELLTRTGYADDVTALAVQRSPTAAEPLVMDVPAEYASLAEVRDAFTGWLDGLGAGSDDRVALELAANEAVTNAIEHAYAGGPDGIVRFEATLRPDGYLECRVVDQGRWREPGPGESSRGRGLMLMERTLDEVLISHQPQGAEERPGARGTVVTLRHRLYRPAMLASDESVAPAPATAVPFAAETAGDGCSLRVQGPVDVTTVERFSRALAAACRGGVRPLTVDLGAVTHLASAGVRSLHEIRDQLLANRQDITLLAPRGSPAQVVLDLVRLPHTVL